MVIHTYYERYEYDKHEKGRFFTDAKHVEMINKINLPYFNIKDTGMGQYLKYDQIISYKNNKFKAFMYAEFIKSLYEIKTDSHFALLEVRIPKVGEVLLSSNGISGYEWKYNPETNTNTLEIGIDGLKELFDDVKERGYRGECTYEYVDGGFEDGSDRDLFYINANFNGKLILTHKGNDVTRLNEGIVTHNKTLYIIIEF